MVALNIWPEKTLDEVCLKITDGAHHSPKSVDDGLPMSSVKDLTRFGLNLDTSRRISREDYQQLVKQGCQPLRGDVLIAKDGATALDTVCEIRTPVQAVLLSSVAILRPDQTQVTPSFLRYFLGSPTTRSSMKAAFTTGAAIPRVVLKDFKRAPIKVPPLPLQRRIASILSAYDDLIENNTRRIAILEEMARRIYEEWFVRFRFPGHEQVKMVESELGLIPEGWRRGSISELYEGLYDGPHATPKPSTSGPVFLGIGNLTETGSMELSSVRHIAEDDFGKWTKRVCPQPGDIVFTYEATLNRYALIPNGFRGCLGRRLALIRTNPKTHSNLYLFCMFFSEGWRQVVAQNTLSGATVDRIPLSKFPSFPVMVPSMPIMAAFDGIVRPMFAEIEVLGRKNQNLRATRDLLLPKLISGELDVSTLPEPEEAIAA